MLVQASDLELIRKYLTLASNETYKLKKDVEIPGTARRRLLELDELQLLCYDKHLIEDYKKL